MSVFYGGDLMPKTSGRVIDYTQEEMMVMTGLSRDQFRRGLVRICEMYGFDIDDFKVEKGNINSEFFFTPEVADLLAILLRNLKGHPLKRTNAKVDEISGTSISDYYKDVINDIDEEVRPIVAEAIFCLESHLVAQNVTDWTEPFVKQMTRFLVNLITLKRQDVGESLKQFTKQFDSMNYYLFRGESVMSLAYDSNIEELQRQGILDDDYRKEINKKLHQNNISIDRLIAEMIRWYLPKSKEVRDSNFKEYIFEDNDFMRWAACGNPNQASPTMKRELYYQLEVNYSANKNLLKNNQYVLEHTRNKNAEWKDIATQVSEGNFCEPQEKSIAEKIKILENNIRSCEKELEGYKNLLTELKEQKNEDEKSELLQDIQQRYVEHCKHTDNDYHELEDAVDKFVGRAIHELLK